MRSWRRGWCARTATSRGGFERLEERLALTGAPTVVDFQVGSSQWTPAFVGYVSGNDPTAVGYSVPTGSSSQLSSLPWNNIDTIAVTFSEDVNVLSNHLSLTGVSVAHVAISNFHYDARTFTAKWTFTAALPKNYYHAEIDGDGMAPVRDLANNALDGEWTTSSSTFPSGNGTSGGDFAFEFRVLPGDATQNGSVDVYDYNASTSRNGLTTSSGSYSAFADVDGSGSHTTSDSSSIYAKLWTSHTSGTPVGAANDAPSSVGRRAISGYVNAVNLAIDLWADFADAETADNQLTYSIVSTSNSSLWSSMNVNAVTGKINLTPTTNSTGLSTIVVSAVDSVGQKTFVTYQLAVGSPNVLPTLSITSTWVSGSTFKIVGYVTDDAPVEGLMVAFSGAFGGRAYVDALGGFEFEVVVPIEEWDDVFGSVEDWRGEYNLESFAYVGIA